MLDLILLAVIALITWCVADEGAWGAGMVLVSVVLAGLVAMNFFEPLALALENHVSSSRAWSSRWDIISLVGLFAAVTLVLRRVTERLVPGYLQIRPFVDQAGRWSCGLLTGCVTTAFLLAALHTAPLPRDFWGHFPPEPERREGPLGRLAPDYQWLGFVQYISEFSLRNDDEGLRVFDAPAYRAGEHSGYWPSFPIRYATRREQLESGQGGADEVAK